MSELILYRDDYGHSSWGKVRGSLSCDTPSIHRKRSFPNLGKQHDVIMIHDGIWHGMSNDCTDLNRDVNVLWQNALLLLLSMFLWGREGRGRAMNDGRLQHLQFNSM